MEAGVCERRDTPRGDKPPSKAHGGDARRIVLARRLHLANLRRLRSLLLAVTAINLAILALMWGTGIMDSLPAASWPLHPFLHLHRILWIVLNLAAMPLLGRLAAGQTATPRLALAETVVVAANMGMVVSVILALFPYYFSGNLFFVAMFAVVPLIRLDLRASLLVIGLPGLALAAGVLLQNPDLPIGRGYAVNVTAMVILSLIGMRYLYAESMRDLLQQDIISRQQAELGRLALTDELTGLPNRRSLAACLDREWRRALREGTGLAAIMIDIDHFKLLNDTRGHAAGDDCLRLVAATLSRCLRRASDMAARYGGEEFLVVLPGVDAVGAMALAESIRLAVEDCGLPHPGSSFTLVTVSLGVAARLAGAYDTPEHLLARADAALYAAKTAGRNRACRADETAPVPPPDVPSSPKTGRPAPLPVVDVEGDLG